MIKSIPFSIRLWLILAGITSILTLLIYASVQQSYRMGANDPQIQIAWDTASQLAQGMSPSQVIPPGQVLIGSELSPFVIIYDYNYKPIAGNGIYDHKLAQVPSGVLEFAKEHGQNQVTWQPDNYTRIALVVETSGDGKSLVAVGRSLRYVEIREHNLAVMTLVAWLLALISSLIGCLVCFKQTKNV